METNDSRTERSVDHDGETYWTDAKPEGDDDFWEKDYWVAYQDGTAKEEGLEVPWWYRWYTSLAYGYEWTRDNQ